MNLKPIEPGCLVLIAPPTSSVKVGVVIKHTGTIPGLKQDAKCTNCRQPGLTWSVEIDSKKYFACKCILTRIDGYDDQCDREESVQDPPKSLVVESILP